MGCGPGVGVEFHNVSVKSCWVARKGQDPCLKDRATNESLESFTAEAQDFFCVGEVPRTEDSCGVGAVLGKMGWERER